MKKSYGIIYKVTNKANGKLYIGQTTKSLSIRRSMHLSKVRNRHDNIAFHNAIRKYGENSFDWEVIGTVSSRKELDELEKYMIKKHDSIDKGYNILEGGNINPILYGEDNPRYGMRLSYSVRKKMSDAQKGEKGYWYGKKHTDDHRGKVSKALQGKKKHRLHGKRLSKQFGEWWLIEFPDGKFKVIQSLRKFCKEYNLHDIHMSEVSRGIRRHNKGYKCKKLNEDLIICGEGELYVKK